MTKGRLEAFSDGVIAIIITIMVLELRPPHSADIASLKALVPVFLSYVLSFIYLGIYWNNHHHMLQVVRKISGASLWANLHLLFWLSLVPFATSWMGDTNFAPWPVFAYGAVLIFAALAYTILARVLVKENGKDSLLGRAVGADTKGNISLVLYAAALAIALVMPAIACLLYIVVAIIWLAPDRRIETVLRQAMSENE